MKVISNAGQIKTPIHNVVAAIGVFDGVHLGHQSLIKEAVRRAKSIHGKSIVFTFWPHPYFVLHPEVPIKYLTDLPYRLQLIAALGVDYCFVIKFTKQFSRLSPSQFIHKFLLKNLQLREIFVGDDFRFGQGRSGDIEYFGNEGKKYGFKVNSHRAIKTSGQKIGSSMIRQLTYDGELKKAAKLLGRPVSVLCRVIRGDGRGKKLGFPTANMDVANVILPPVGVYAVRIRYGLRVFNGMANVGYRPSFQSAASKIHFEVHIFDAQPNLYGKKILVEFISRIRNEKVFSHPHDLIAQLRRDEIKSRKILASKID